MPKSKKETKSGLRRGGEYKASRYGGFDQGQSGRGQPTIAGRKARLKKVSKKKRPAKYKKLMNKLAELRAKRSQTPKLRPGENEPGGLPGKPRPTRPPEKNLGVTTIDENNNETSSPGKKPLPPMSEMLRGRKYSAVAAKLKKKRKKRQFKSKAAGSRPGF